MSSKWFDKRAIWEAAAFFAAALLGLVMTIAYSDKPIGNRELTLLLATVAFTLIIYYIRVPRLYITRRVMIEDLLLAAGIALGKPYRLNIMRLKPHKDEAERCFGFLCHFNMQDLHRYDGLIKLSTPGAGQAYIEKRVVYLSPLEVDRGVDSYPQHLWSVNIESHNGPRCVLNIDTNVKEVSASVAEHLKTVVSDLARVIARHNPGKLPLEH